MPSPFTATVLGTSTGPSSARRRSFTLGSEPERTGPVRPDFYSAMQRGRTGLGKIAWWGWSWHHN